MHENRRFPEIKGKWVVLTVMGLIVFAFLIARRLLLYLRSAFTADNFIVLLCFVLLIGIAQYSGAVLRRPNVSIYLSLILGLIHYQTCVCPVGRVCTWRGEWL